MTSSSKKLVKTSPTATSSFSHLPQPSPPPSASPIRPLSDSGPLASVPTEYLSLNSIADDQRRQQQIPVIDLSHLKGQNPELRSQTIVDLAGALEDWGFLVVVNHGLSERVTEAVMEKSRGFFKMGEEEKREYSGKGVMDPIRYGTSFNPAVEEVRYWRDYLKLVLHPNFHCPHKPEGLREAVFEFSSCIREMLRELLRGVSENLGLDQGYMEKAVELDSGTQLFTANFYPPCPRPELVMGMPPHSDHGFLTVLFQNGVEGLQVKHRGSWVDVKPPPNSLLINLGDHMEILTNGKYESVVHRALLNEKVTRMSVLVLHGPSQDKVVEPAPEFVNRNGNPVAYRGVEYGEFLKYQQSNQLKGKSVLELLKLQVS